MNNVLFLASTSHHFHYGSISAADNMKCVTLEMELQNIQRCCAVREFQLILIIVDVQFKCLKDRNRLGTHVNVLIKGEHAKLSEMHHRVIEERCICHYYMLPFDSLSRIMVIHLMKIVDFHAYDFFGSQLFHIAFHH